MSFFRSPLLIAFVALNAMLVYWYLGYQSQKQRNSVKMNHNQRAVKTSTIPYRDYTVDELFPFDGVNSPHILLAVDQRVYDVSSAPEYYGFNGSYSGFAGRDASRYLATHTIPKPNLPKEPFDDLNDLSEEERKALNSWVDFFETKYPRVGTLVPVHGWAGSDHEEDPEAIRGAFINSKELDLINLPDQQ
jgi:membrane-associated progesterone receptor component